MFPWSLGAGSGDRVIHLEKSEYHCGQGVVHCISKMMILWASKSKENPENMLGQGRTNRNLPIED